MQFAHVYPIVYRILHPLFPNCLWCGANDSQDIALTFDDGPHPEYTPKLLKILDSYNIPASFFLLGSNVQRYPRIAREISIRGHWIGIHGYQHQSFPFLKREELEESLIKTKAAIAQATQLPPEKICDVRPPNGLFTPQILHQLNHWGYRVVMWTVVPEDWVRPGINMVTQRVLNHVGNGALIVLHDGYYGGQDVAQTVVNLIPQLLDQGYRFVTIETMWKKNNSSLNYPEE